MPTEIRYEVAPDGNLIVRVPVQWKKSSGRTIAEDPIEPATGTPLVKAIARGLAWRKEFEWGGTFRRSRRWRRRTGSTRATCGTRSTSHFYLRASWRQSLPVGTCRRICRSRGFCASRASYGTSRRGNWASPSEPGLCPSNEKAVSRKRGGLSLVWEEGGLYFPTIVTLAPLGMPVLLRPSQEFSTLTLIKDSQP